MQRFTIDPERSTIVIEARSSVGPIAWEATRPAGWFTVTIGPDGPEPGGARGELELELERMTSGNRVYDAELLRRVEARRFPRARVELTAAERVEESLVDATGSLEFHGVTRRLEGTLRVEDGRDGGLLVSGEHVVDIRDFELPPPTMMMLKIYPDVRVHLVVAAQPEA